MLLLVDGDGHCGSRGGVGDISGDGNVAVSVADLGVVEGDALHRGDVDAMREVVVEVRHDAIDGQQLHDGVQQGHIKVANS